MGTAFELRRESLLAECIPGRRGDPVDVAAFGPRQWRSYRFPRRRGRSEKPSGAVVLTGERVCTGESFHSERDRPGITDATGESKALQLKSRGRCPVSALLSDEAEFGKDQRAARLEAHLAVPFEHCAQVLLGNTEPAFPARDEREAGLGTHFCWLEALLGSQLHRPLVEHPCL